MRRPAAIAAITLLAGLVSHARADGVSDKLRIHGDVASAWLSGEKRVLQIENGVTIQTDDATLTADHAVIWLKQVPDTTLYAVEVALAGNAKVVRGDLTRTGDQLFVTVSVRADVQLDVTKLENVDRSSEIHYLSAAQLRRQTARGEVPPPMIPAMPVDPTAPMDTTQPTSMPATTNPTTGPTTGPTSKPTTRKAKETQPITFSYKRAQMTMSPDGKVALVLDGDVFLIETRANGDRMELQAEHAVLFTQFNSAKEMMASNGMRSFDSARDLDSVYLEGDVRLDMMPGDIKRAQQSLRASRLVYDFGQDRAVLTDALLHSLDPGAAAPLVVRAHEMRKLGTDRYEGDHATITTTDFATPSIALATTKVSIRQHATDEGTSFFAYNVTPRIYDFPVFYFPVLYGNTANGLFGLRDAAISNGTHFGQGIQTTWGLFETFGFQKPDNGDASYDIDYYSERGFAGGFDANYSGGSVNENTLQPWAFEGDFTSYLAYDDGTDHLGKNRRPIGHPDSELRSRFQWDHQQFLNDGWQVQARAGYVSDPTFMEQWFRNEFRNGLPTETALYLKRSQDTEVFTALFNIDTSHVATVADQLQEVRIDPNDDFLRSPLYVEKLPEITYHRLGDAWFDDRATLVSNNSASLLHFSESRANLSDLGLRATHGKDYDESFVGIPSYAYTGYTDNYVIRGDSRQELDFPMGDDRIRFTPYGMARYTAYSDSPGDGEQDRLLAGVGLRSSTQFSKVYDDAESKFFDIHRVRHIIEPQLNLFTSAETTDRDELYQYDEGVDGVSDVSSAEFVVRQRWQTKRGGEERWRSVDFVTLNTGVVFFGNEPDEIEPIGGPGTPPKFTDAGAFRGVYLNSEPEASIARSTAFADASWRISDTTALLGDVAWNMERQDLATSGIGFSVERDPRVSYFAGLRYIGEINSLIATLTFDYAISTRYSVAFHESYDITADQNQSLNMEIVRKFEQFVVTVNVYFDNIDSEGGIGFTVSPRNLPFGGTVNGKGSRR